MNPEDEYTTSCLLMVLLAVSISRLTRYDSSQYKAELQGILLNSFSFYLFIYFNQMFFALAHGNNAHCIANAINTLAGCLFYDMGADFQFNIESRLTEFLAVSISDSNNIKSLKNNYIHIQVGIVCFAKTIA